MTWRVVWHDGQEGSSAVLADKDAAVKFAEDKKDSLKFVGVVMEEVVMVPMVFIVGADKGGTGKSTVARAILRRLPGARAVDTDRTLSRFYPSALVLDPSKVDDQIRLFEQMPEVTLVDSGAGQLSSLLRSMRELGLLADVDRGTMDLRVIHVVGPDTSSMEEVVPVGAQLGERARHVIVKNHIDPGTQYFDFDQDRVRGYLGGDVQVVDFPHLEARVAEAVQVSGQPFEVFEKDEAHHLILRRRLAYWLSLVDAELDGAGVVG